ncbi:MAG: gamma-glutamyltransferase family protein [Inquilinus sp.]|nr:gamma-glutamyltransferase family protein [Inquilinus sp.]
MFTTRPEITGTFGVVSTTHWLASAVGMAILERGGNAFDAAVAAGMTLQVAEPHMNGPGGDLPAILYRADIGNAQVLCGQGTAPTGATIAHYRGLGLDIVPGTGFLAAVIPGAFDAWMLMLRDHGTMTLRQVLEPALGYAENGVPLVPRVCDTIAQVRDMFVDEWTSSADVFLPGGSVPTPGRLFVNRDLAATWRRILDEAETADGDRVRQIEAARGTFYRGFVAEAIDRFCRSEAMDSSGRRHAGVLTGQDMAGWQAHYEEPLTYDFHGHTVLKPGPWSQGPVFLQQLALLKGIDLAAMDPLGADFVHTVTESIKLAYADREAFYGDPKFVEVPVRQLLSDAYNDDRRRLIGGDASLELRPGTVDGFGGAIPDTGITATQASPMSAGVGEPTVARNGETRGDTVHIDVIDRFGNMVSAMPSGGWLQSSPVVPGLGFPLPTRAQMFWLEEGLPASLAPCKRPRTTLSPSLAFRDGLPYMAFGTPGGDGQDQWQPIFFLRHVLYGMNLQEAIDAPSFHSDHFPSSFYPRQRSPGRLVVESRFPDETQADLKARGHRLELAPPWSEGRLCATSQDKGLLRAGANPRAMQGYAAGR